MKSRSSRVWQSTAALFLFCIAQSSVAEDIDLFVQPGGAADIPNVLFIIDNTANWNNVFTLEKNAIRDAFLSLPVNEDGTAKFRVGVMFTAESGGANDSTRGGYVRAAVRPMTDPYQAKYAAMFDVLDINRDKSNGGQSALALAEAYLYYKGTQPYSGDGKEKTDYTGNNANTWGNSASTAAMKTAMKAVHDLPGNALASKNAQQYLSPIPSGYCGRNYIIYISNGPNQLSSNLIGQAEAMLAAQGGSAAQIPVNPSGSQTDPIDEWARWMYLSPQKITTYTLDVQSNVTGQSAGWTAILKSMADVSKGKYYFVAGTGSAISVAIDDALAEIQAVNSVFASVSLPVSVDNSGTYLNQVYIGMFRPDAEKAPRWVGNLKQYKLGLDANEDNLKLQDAAGVGAINPATGFVRDCARSFWTPLPAEADTYWAFREKDYIAQNTYCSALAGTADSDSPDGAVVEKGAQAYKLRNMSNRQIRTCTGSCSSLTDFNTTNITPSDLGLTATDTTQRDLIVNWATFWDNMNEDGDKDGSGNPITNEVRPYIHGDVVHSRPVAINLATGANADTTNAKVVVFYGGNDGVLRAINGNRGDLSDANVGLINAKSPGSELWSFIPSQFLPKLKRLRDNTTKINYVGTDPSTTPTPLPKPYGMDGAITSYQDGTNTWIFTTMRRGGRAVYAFDVSLMAADTSPTPPSLLWWTGCPDNFSSAGTTVDTDCKANMSDVGQTWSALNVLKAESYKDGAAYKPMLIMGGGYDVCEDGDPSTCTSSTKGDGIYVLDAATGAYLTRLDTDRAVVADVFVVKDSAGRAKWAYAADMEGNVYRIHGATANTDLGQTAPTSWQITKIASLGCDSGSSCAEKRKFMFSPDVTRIGDVYYLLLGSGDREKPLYNFDNAYEVDNLFVMIKDMPTSTDWLTSESGNCSDNVLCLESLVDIGVSDATPSKVDLDERKGWYLQMRDHEQVVTSAITVFGVTTFSTHTPEPEVGGACSSKLGTARVYNVYFRNAAPAYLATDRSAEVEGGGLPPSPVAGIVRLDDGREVPFVIGADPDSPLESKLPEPPSLGSKPKSLTYWYLEKGKTN